MSSDSLGVLLLLLGVGIPWIGVLLLLRFGKARRKRKE